MSFSKTHLSKLNQGLLFFVLITLVLYYGKPFLIPFFFAIMLSMLMAPVCRKLDGKGMHRIFSCLICVLILLLVFISILTIMAGQISSFVGNLVQVEQKITALFTSLQSYIERKFNIPVEEQTAFIKEETQHIGQFIRRYFTGVLRSSLQLLMGLIMTLVFTFLFLYHKEKYYTFFLRFTIGDTPEQKKYVLNSIGKVSQHYLIGRAISIILLFVLYALALFFIGIENALLLAAVAALFNIIPYLGPVLAAIFPFLVALVTEQNFQPALWVLISFCLFQALDNYFVTPYFLGGEVSLSALATIVAMISGGFVWGVAGMILFIPLLSIVKIVLDHIPGLEHYGHLIGDQGKPPSGNFNVWFKKIFSNRRS